MKKSAKDKIKDSMKERVRQKAKEPRKGAGLLKLPPDVEVFFPEEKGVFSINVVPYKVTSKNHLDGVEPGTLWYRRPYYIHFIDRRPVACPKSIGKPCPICEEIARLSRDFEENKEMIGALKRREMALFNIIDPADKKKTVKVFDWSSFKFNMLLERELSETEDDDDYAFADLEGGSTIKFRVSTDTFGGSSFLKTTRLDFIRPRTTYDDTILDKVVNLDEIVSFKSYEEIAKLFIGSDESDNDDDEEEAPKKEKKAPKKEASKKKVVEEKDDDDDEDWEDDDDEESDDDDNDSESDDDNDENADDDDDDDDESDDDEDWEDDDEDDENADDDEDDEDEEESEDDDDEDWEDDDEDDDGELTTAQIKAMKKEEILELFDDDGELNGKTKKSMTALRRSSLDELRQLACRLIK